MHDDKFRECVLSCDFFRQRNGSRDNQWIDRIGMPVIRIQNTSSLRPYLLIHKYTHTLHYERFVLIAE